MTMFGTFLISRGIVTSVQVVQALDLQRAQRTPTASVAMRMGVVDAHQALKALDQERATGRRFEDCVVALGFANHSDMRRVVEESESSGPMLGEVLISMGALTRAELVREIVAYERNASLTPRFGVPIPTSKSGTRDESRGAAIVDIVRRRGTGT